MAGDSFIVFGSPMIGEEEISAVTKTLRTAWIGTGPRVQEFEEAIRSYSKAGNAIALGSCTAALHLSMVVSGVERGDEVITTPLTFAATAAAVIHTGAIPVFVDVERDSMNIDPDLIECAITENTRALLPVHFAGRPCDMDRIGEIARRHGDLLVIEDAAHALESEYKGRKVGSISTLTCFSFYVTKSITTVEGGMVCTDRNDLAEMIKIYGLHGMSADAWDRFNDKGYKHYEVVFPGFKYNMTDIQASLGLCQVLHIDSWMRRRKEIWERYNEAFRNLPVFLPKDPDPGTVHSRHLYTLLIDIDEAGLSRDEFVAALYERGIGTGVHYRSLHLHQYYRERFGYRPEDFPNAHWISERTVSLPLSAKLTEEEVDRIIRAVRDVMMR
jgi:dTDP-4-amino-4,6-dideoxygalactose transaminase